MEEANGAVANIRHHLLVMLKAILPFFPVTPKWSQQLILAFELRGLVKLSEDLHSVYPTSLLEAAFLGCRCEVVVELLFNFPKTKVVELIRRDEAFKKHLIANPDACSKLITDRNVFSCQSRSLFAAYFGFPSFLETLEKLQRFKSLIRFVGPNGSLQEISIF